MNSPRFTPRPAGSFLDGSHEPSDEELRAIALNMRANFIETGSVTMSATDVQGQLGRVRLTAAECRARGFEVKALSPEQVALVSRLRAMAAAELQASCNVVRRHDAPGREQVPLRLNTFDDKHQVNGWREAVLERAQVEDIVDHAAQLIGLHRQGDAEAFDGVVDELDESLRVAGVIEAGPVEGSRAGQRAPERARA